MKNNLIYNAMLIICFCLFSGQAVAQNKVVVIPLDSGGKEVNALLVPIAIANVNGSSVTFDQNVGFASVTRTANATLGEYRLTTNATMVGDDPVIIATSYSNSPDDEIVTANSVSATEIEINIVNGAGESVDSDFYVVVYADTE